MFCYVVSLLLYLWLMGLQCIPVFNPPLNADLQPDVPSRPRRGFIMSSWRAAGCSLLLCLDPCRVSGRRNHYWW